MELGVWKDVYPVEAPKGLSSVVLSELKKKKDKVKKAIKTITLEPVGPIGQAKEKHKPKPPSPAKVQKELSSLPDPEKAPTGLSSGGGKKEG